MMILPSDDLIALKQKMNLTDEILKETVELIQNLNPKPGEGNI